MVQENNDNYNNLLQVPKIEQQDDCGETENEDEGLDCSTRFIYFSFELFYIFFFFFEYSLLKLAIIGRHVQFDSIFLKTK